MPMATAHRTFWMTIATATALTTAPNVRVVRLARDSPGRSALAAGKPTAAIESRTLEPVVALAGVGMTAVAGHMEPLTVCIRGPGASHCGQKNTTVLSYHQWPSSARHHPERADHQAGWAFPGQHPGFEVEIGMDRV